MEEKNVIEICVGVGINQFFPETIKIVIEDERQPMVDDDIDLDKYYYY
jgi:hypothetical protein